MDVEPHNDLLGPKQILFARSLSFNLPYKGNIQATTEFITAYGPRSLQWRLHVNLPYAISLSRKAKFDDREVVPDADARIVVTFRDVYGTSEVVAQPYSHMRNTLRVDDVTFIRRVREIAGEWNSRSGVVQFLAEISFSAEEFCHIRLKEDDSLPTPALILARNAMAHEFEELETDVKVFTTDGVCDANQCILFLYSGYFESFFTYSPHARAVDIPYPTHIFRMTQNALLFDLMPFDKCSNVDIALFISCLVYLRPKFDESCAYWSYKAETELATRLMDKWWRNPLIAVLEYLNVSQIYGLRYLRYAALNIIADRFYETFKSTYNKDAVGHEKVVYDQLTTVHSFINGVSAIKHYKLHEIIDEIREKNRRTRRAFRFTDIYPVVL